MVAGSHLLLALVLMTVVTACTGRADSSSGPQTPQSSRPESNQRDAARPGPGRRPLTWPIDLVPANFNYNEIDGTDARQLRRRSRRCMPTTFVTDAARHADLEPRLPGVRANADDRTQAGRDLPDQPEGRLVRRHAHHLGGFPLAVEGQQRHRQGVPDLVVERLRGHRERAARARTTAK